MGRAALITLGSVALLLGGCEEAEKTTPVEVASASPLVALTPTEFNNTVRDLLALPDNVAEWPERPDLKIAPVIGAGEGIFGVKVAAPDVWPYAFPEEAGVDGFEGIAKGQVPSTYQIEQLQLAARHFASFVGLSPVFFVCDAKAWPTLATPAQDSCAEKSLLRFTQRAWRRPISATEQDRVRALWATMKVMGTPEQALALSASAILQAPSFLFRIERGDTSRATGDAIPLTDWEVASRLSFYLWDSMPDGALFAAAAKGELRTPAQVEAQARRMLKDPKAQQAALHFHHQWLGTNKLHRISPARRIYGPLFGIEPAPPLDTTGDGEWPALMNPLRTSYKKETELFVRDAIFGRPGLSEDAKAAANVGTLTALLTMENGYVSKYSAPVYGVGECDSVSFPGGKTGGKGTGCELDDKVVDMSPENAVQAVGKGVAAASISFSVTLHPAVFPKGERAGVLTLPSVLALGAHAVHPSPIKRGKRLLERIACLHFSPPPPNAEAAAPPDAPNDDSTNRERTVASTKPPECTGCHDGLGLNMAGFAYEHYDSFGHWRAKDGVKNVDASGTLPIPGEPAIAFTDGVDLAKKLAKSERVRDCYVQHQTHYALGLTVAKDHPALQALQKTFRTDDRVLELLVAVTKSDLFRYRKAPASTGGK